MTIVAKIAETKGFGQAGALGLGAGANLRTPCGDRRVDNLRPGDLIVTRDNGLHRHHEKGSDHNRIHRLVWPGGMPALATEDLDMKRVTGSVDGAVRHDN